MTRVLVFKVLRDLRVGLVVVCALLFLFQLLWAHVTRRISGELLPVFNGLGLSPDIIRDQLFKGPGQIIQTIMGGESIKIEMAQDLMSIAYVHPLILTILCIWAVGRASGAIAGEIDRGTMELLLAQPIRRSEVILAHFIVDLVTIPLICLTMWFGTFVGTWLVGMQDNSGNPGLLVDPLAFAPALFSVLGLVISVTGYTMWISAQGRSRNRVLGGAILFTLVQFLINVIGQLWERMDWMRPFTVFYHYQPQPLILDPNWPLKLSSYEHFVILVGVGLVGYLLAWWKFCKRDLPAPL